jgi:chemotaxis signal transduction protein
LLIIRDGGHEYALRADRVMRFTGSHADTAKSDTAVFVDVSELIAELRFPDQPIGKPSFESGASYAEELNALADATPSVSISRKSLAIDVGNATRFISFANVLELADRLPMLHLPEPPPFFAGAAFYRGTLLPVISAGALLGTPAEVDDGQGALVIVEVGGHLCVLAISKLIGISHQARFEDTLDLDALLTPLLEDWTPSARPTAQNESSSFGEQYLLLECSGQLCAFAADAVAHIHEGVHLCNVPAAARASLAGVAAVGGRILPVVELAELLKLPPAPDTQNLVELTIRRNETFGLLAEKIVGLQSLPPAAFLRPPENTMISALATIDSKIAWILDPAVIARHARWKSHAA